MESLLLSIYWFPLRRWILSLSVFFTCQLIAFIPPVNMSTATQTFRIQVLRCEVLTYNCTDSGQLPLTLTGSLVKNHISLSLFASLLLIKGHTRWSKNLTWAVVLTISLSSSSPLSTNMRIPNTAEIFTFFAAIGQFSNLRKNVIVPFMTLYATNACRLPFHIGSADWELSLAPADVDIADSEFRVSDVIPAGADDADLAPACSRAYTVKPGDNCLSIAEKNGAPTLVSSYRDIVIAYFIYALKYSYQIICQNDQINGKCSNLGTSIGQVKLVFTSSASRISNWYYYCNCRIFALDSRGKIARKLLSLQAQTNTAIPRPLLNNLKSLMNFLWTTTTVIMLALTTGFARHSSPERLVSRLSRF